MASTTTYPLPGFPSVHLAEDGTQISVRAMLPTDGDALLAFFRAIPERDRFFLKDDVCSDKVIAQWTENLDYNRAIPLLGLDGNRIVAEGVLHRRRSGARRHLGEARITVDPEYRNKGVGRGLLGKLAEIAEHEDIRCLQFEVVADVEEPARHAALLLGFTPVALLPDQVVDADGSPHDLIVMQMNVHEQFPPPPSVF